MKKFLIFLFTFFSFSSFAFADVSFPLLLGSYSDEKSLFEDTSLYWNYNQTSHSLTQSYYELLSYYSSNLSSDYPYYVIYISFLFDNNFNIISGYPVLSYSSSSSYSFSADSDSSTILLSGSFTDSSNGGYLSSGSFISNNTSRFLITNFNQSNGITYNIYSVFDYNINLKPFDTYLLSNFWSDSTLVLQDDNSIPKVKDLILYNSWSDYENNFLEGYTTVNLNNYDYVLLSLKNYSLSDSFQTILQVKGQIGITPIYNFGQTSKDSVTGVKVQDRCNIGYTEYTSYPFYILSSDLQNNAIFAVKSCEIDSSFRFDSSVFDVTFVTQENADNPIITINGKTYNVIPYDDLPSTATQNEEDNYIPGQSGSPSDTGGLDSAIKNIQNKMSEIWNTFTYFTDFVGQMFSVLPIELRTILISAFTIAIILGLIKIFIGH